MGKVQIEIEIPDGHEIVDVVNLTAQYGGRPEYRIVTRPATPFEICGQPSDWPDWLICDWVAKDKSGSVFGYFSEPTKGISTWRANNAYLITGLTAIDIPGPWEQSLRENPRRKK